MKRTDQVLGVQKSQFRLATKIAQVAMLCDLVKQTSVKWSIELHRSKPGTFPVGQYYTVN